MNYVRVERTFDLVPVDLYGPLPKGRDGVMYVFVVLDTFSKFVKLYSVKRATSRVLSEKIMRDYMVNIGKPRVILSYHRPQFISGRWRQTLGWEGIIPKHTAVYHPPVSYTHLDVYKRQTQHLLIIFVSTLSLSPFHALVHFHHNELI